MEQDPVELHNIDEFLLANVGRHSFVKIEVDVDVARM